MYKWLELELSLDLINMVKYFYYALPMNYFFRTSSSTYGRQTRKKFQLSIHNLFWYDLRAEILKVETRLKTGLSV